MPNSYKKYILPNGLKLLAISMPNVRSATSLLLIGAGSKYETRKINGLSHFLEHMAFKGTKSRPTALQIAEEIDSIGAENNAFTGKEYTGYYIKSSCKHLPLTIDIISDMIQNSLLKEEEIQREKGVIIEEINMYEDTPASLVGEYFERLLYGDTPLGRRIIGEKENIRNMQRKNFVEYMEKWYSPQNAVFAVAGGIDPEKVKSLAEEKFSHWNTTPINPVSPIAESQTKPAVSLTKKDTEQTHLILGVRAYPREDPRRWALSVLSAVLGGGMSSRLFHEVRERRGLAYYIKSYVQRYAEAGYFAVRAGLDSKRITQAIKVILTQFDRVRNRLVNEKELKKAKEYIKGGLILSLEDSYEVASLYGSSLLLEKKIRTPEYILKKIDTVKAREVKAVAQDIFKEEKLNLAIIGQFEDRQKFESLLQL